MILYTNSHEVRIDKKHNYKKINHMNRIYILIIVFVALGITTNYASAQALYNNGATINISAGTNVYVSGDFTNATGSTVTNAGNLRVSGNTINNASMSSASGGTLLLEGSTAQTLSGTADYFATNVIVNNALGITLAAKLRVDGTMTFTSGLITNTSSNFPVVFTANGSVSGTPSNASHVNGFVVKEGNGSFTYPVGDATTYQKVDVNLTANSTGMQVKYNAADAGTGIFTTIGTEATALVSYNAQENWDITPLSSAAGTVTIYWDGYKDTYTNALSQRKVAHKVSGNWLNEGTTATGTTGAGNVTSNSISSWSPFALGSITNTLPLHWLNVTGNLNPNKQAVLNFKVIENNVAKYEIEKSNDGSSFTSIATISSKGNGENNYQFTDVISLVGITFYRVKQIDNDSRYSYSSVIKLSNQLLSILSIYPNPVKDLLCISDATVGNKVVIMDISGKVLQQLPIVKTSFNIDMSKYSRGIYLLKTDNGSILKIIKE